MSAAGALARRYAKALLSLAKEQNAVDRVQRDLAALAAAWEESKELRDAFQNPIYGSDVRRKITDALAARLGVMPMLKNTLAMLSDRRRMRHLADIAEAYTNLAEAESGRVRAEVVSATALPEAYFAELQKTLEQVTGRKVQIVKRVDPTLIAGVVTRVGDRVFDGSLKNRLVELEDELLDRNVYFNQ